jgi:hypothetical protein
MLDQPAIDQFHRDGFLRWPQVFGGDELELLRLAVDRVQADGMAGRGQHHRYHPLAGGLETYVRTEGLWERDPAFAAAAAHPRLLAAVGQCLGQAFLPAGSALLCKSPFAEVPLPWHQDPPYADPQQQRTHAPPELCAGICLDRSTAENGCLWALPGHHLVGHVDLRRLGQEELYARARPLEMAPGDLLLLARSTPHGSRGTSSPWPHRLYLIDFDPGPGAGGQALAQRLAAARRQARLDPVADPEVHLGGEGFAFAGQPSTPPGHWAALLAQVSSQEFHRKKQLAT